MTPPRWAPARSLTLWPVSSKPEPEGVREDVTRLRHLWDVHIHRPFPAGGDDPRVQEIALYASWLGGIVEVALRRGALDPQHVEMLKVRRGEGNQRLFRAAGELGEPYRSHFARLLAIEDVLSELN